MNKFQTSRMIALCASVVILSGCAGVSVKQGEIYTPGMVITAEDSSFTLKSGEAFKTPFYNELYGPESNKLVDELPEVIGAKKARLVRVSIPGLKEPLYGAMMFPAVHKNARGPATRVLGVEVPQRFIDAAMGAKISVVYERVALDNGEFDYAWILWLSDHPLVTKPQAVVAKEQPAAVVKVQPVTANPQPVVATSAAVVEQAQPVVAQ